jgi:hypothetical protein
MEGVQAAMTARSLEQDQWRNSEEWRLVSGRRRQPDGWMDGRTDGRTDGRMDGWMAYVGSSINSRAPRSISCPFLQLRRGVRSPILKAWWSTIGQRFSNFFQVGTTFISQNVLRTALLLTPLKANCLRSSTTVCDTQFTLILFFSVFLLMLNQRGPQGQNPRTTCPWTTVWETLP